MDAIIVDVANKEDSHSRLISKIQRHPAIAAISTATPNNHRLTLSIELRGKVGLLRARGIRHRRFWHRVFWNRREVKRYSVRTGFLGSRIRKNSDHFKSNVKLHGSPEVLRLLLPYVSFVAEVVRLLKILISTSDRFWILTNPATQKFNLDKA